MRIVLLLYTLMCTLEDNLSPLSRLPGLPLPGHLWHFDGVKKYLYHFLILNFEVPPFSKNIFYIIIN